MGKGCEAEIHAPNCPCVNCNRNTCRGCRVKLTHDHFTPQCIGKVWGQRTKFRNRSENIQMLSRECHDLKDESTPFRLSLARKLQRGKEVTLEDYIEMRNQHDRRCSE